MTKIVYSISYLLCVLSFVAFLAVYFLIALCFHPFVWSKVDALQEQAEQKMIDQRGTAYYLDYSNRMILTKYPILMYYSLSIYFPNKFQKFKNFFKLNNLKTT